MDLKRLEDEINETSVEFLLNDLDVAMTMLDVAETTTIKETAQRNHQNARKAYDTVLRLLPQLKLDAAQQQTMDEQLSSLKNRLETLGWL